MKLQMIMNQENMASLLSAHAEIIHFGST